MLPPSIEWDHEYKQLKLLDQRVLPQRVETVICDDYESAALSIENMTVRGAPAIGAAAAYGAALAAMRGGREEFDAAVERLAKTRPTAVNLFWAIDRVKKAASAVTDETLLSDVVEKEANNIFREDIAVSKKLSEYGAALLPQNSTIITHCNAGALATCGYGTALGILRCAREIGKSMKIYADETRPRLQGARLTVFELEEDNFDVTLITDSMACFLMSKSKIDACIVGADRVAKNGDTANKIGTYNLAVAAKYHNVPFYVAAPLSTIDKNCPNGSSINIEERNGEEIKRINGQLITAEKAKVWNPSFDITPAVLITSIITEAGVFEHPYDFLKFLK